MACKVEDISLQHLEGTDWISVRAINICRNNRLNSLNEIISFYKTNGSFKNLENCGKKIEKELSKICKGFQEHSFDTIIEKIKELDRIKKLVSEFSEDDIKAIDNHIQNLLFKLSVRGRNGLLSLFTGTPQTHELIDKIYSSTFSFSTIRNIGDKTVKELEDFKGELLIFIKKFQLEENVGKSTRPIIITDLDENLTEIVDKLNPFKKAALNRHIEYHISNLSVRAKNGITEFFGSTFSAKEVIEKIYSYSFDFYDIKNIGSKTASELNSFKDEISSFIKTLQFIEDEQLSREYAKLIVKTTFSNLPVDFDEQFENVFDTTGKIKLFKLILFLLEKGHLLNEREKELFHFLYTETKPQSLDKIAKDLDLTRERVRQIKVILEDEIQDYFRFILSFNSQDIINYDITSANHFKIIDDFFVGKINASEDVKFNVRFYSIVFGLFLENSHSVLGDNETISGKRKSPSNNRYKNCYIIDNLIFNSFNFEIFTYEVSLKLSERITETYALHFEGYLLQFVKQDGKHSLSTIKLICEAILFNEFDLVVDNEGYIVFERNIKKPMLDYVLEILEELGEMTKVEDISNAINEKYPGLETNEQSVRSTLQREKGLFIYIGRTSTYGLKKWETENTSLKGGTIRDIAEEYLEKHNNPQHIYDIVRYVKKYRNTSSTSIFRNIQAEENNRFVLFEGGFIGLKNKIYAPDDIVFKRIAGTNFRMEILKKFSGWNYDKVVEYYVQTYDYKPVQVINLFETKIQTGEIFLNPDSTITI